MVQILARTTNGDINVECVVEEWGTLLTQKVTSLDRIMYTSRYQMVTSITGKVREPSLWRQFEGGREYKFSDGESALISIISCTYSCIAGGRHGACTGRDTPHLKDCTG